MPLPAGPWAIQTNWSGSDVWPYWEQANANWLGDCLQTVEPHRQAMRPSQGQDTCTLTCTDPLWAVVPGAALLRDGDPNPLYPNVIAGNRGQRTRVLAKTGATWYPQFFGYIAEISPTPTDAYPATVTVRLESPLMRWAQQSVIVPELPAGSPIYDPANLDASALWQLFLAMGLAGSPFVQLDAPTAGIALPQAWGGASVQVGQALTELLALSLSVLSCDPQYAENAGDPDYVLHWQQPAPTATVTWDSLAGDLHAGSSVVFSSDTP